MVTVMGPDFACGTASVTARITPAETALTRREKQTADTDTAVIPCWPSDGKPRPPQEGAHSPHCYLRSVPPVAFVTFSMIRALTASISASVRVFSVG